MQISARQTAHVINTTILQKLAWACEMSHQADYRTEIDKWALRTTKRKIHNSQRLPTEIIYSPTAEGGLGLATLSHVIDQRSAEFLHKVLNVGRDGTARDIARGCIAEIGNIMHTKQAPLRLATVNHPIPAAITNWPLVRMIQRAGKLGYRLTHRDSPATVLTPETRDSTISTSVMKVLTRHGLTQLEDVANMETLTPYSDRLLAIRGVGDISVLTLRAYLDTWTQETLDRYTELKTSVCGFSPAQIRQATALFASTPRATAPDDSTIHVYTDGSFIEEGAIGSYGVFFPHLGIQEYGRVPFSDCSYRSEWFAITRAVQLVRMDFKGEVNVHTDSLSAIQAWETWQTSPPEKRRKTRDRDLIRFLDKLRSQRGCRITLSFVRGHSGIAGNEIADSLATRGNQLPPWMTPANRLDTTPWPDTWSFTYNGHPITMPVKEHMDRTRAAKLRLTTIAHARCQLHVSLAESECNNGFLRDPFIEDKILRVNYLARGSSLRTPHHISTILGKNSDPGCRVCGAHTDDQIHSLTGCRAAKKHAKQFDTQLSTALSHTFPLWDPTSFPVRSPLTGLILPIGQGRGGTDRSAWTKIRALLGGLPNDFTQAVESLQCMNTSVRSDIIRKTTRFLNQTRKRLGRTAHATWRDHCHESYRQTL